MDELKGKENYIILRNVNPRLFVPGKSHMNWYSFKLLFPDGNLYNRDENICAPFRELVFLWRNSVYFYQLYMCYVYLLYYVCISVLILDAGLLARSQYPEGPATGHLDTGFSWFPCVYKRMLRWFPSFQVAATCFSCSPPDLNFLVTFFHICVHVK